MRNETQDPDIQRLFHQAAEEIEVPSDLGERASTVKTSHQRPRYWAIGGAAAALVVGVVVIATIRPDDQEEPRAASAPSLPEVAENPAQVTAPPASTGVADEPSGPAYVPGNPISPSGLLVFADDFDQVVHDAEQSLIAQCMESAGFEYESSPRPPVQPDRPDVWDETYRRAHGYGFEPLLDIDGAAMDAFNEQQQDPAWQAAWSGTSAEGDGCIGAATQQVEEPGNTEADLASQEFSEASIAWRRSEVGDGERESNGDDANPVLVSAVDDWAACMAERGYTASDPTDFAIDTRDNRPTGDWSFDSPPPSEVDTALDDWTCQQDTGFVDRFYGTLQASVVEFAEQNSTTVDEMNAASQRTLDRALLVLDQEPDSPESEG